MTKKADIQFDDKRILVSGDLDFTSVMSVYKESLVFFVDHYTAVIDFKKVTSSNSAALALIVEWLKYAKTNRKKVKFTNLPEHLLEIVKATDTSPLIFEDL